MLGCVSLQGTVFVFPSHYLLLLVLLGGGRRQEGNAWCETGELQHPDGNFLLQHNLVTSHRNITLNGSITEL